MNKHTRLLMLLLIVCLVSIPQQVRADEEMNTPSGYTWSPFDLFTQYLAVGDFIGFLVAIYTVLLGEVFYGIIALIISVPLYLRTQSLAYLSIMWITLGSILGFLLPVGATNIGFVFIVLGVTGILYKLAYEASER